MNLKSLALISTSIAALSFSATTALAAPPPPTTTTMGYIDVGLTQWWDDFDYPMGNTYSESWVSYTGAGRVNMPYTSRTNFQVDFFADASLDEGYRSGGDYGVGVGNVGGALHFNWRDPNEGLLGGFVAVGRVYDYVISAPAFMAGFEGQHYCGNWTFGAQLGYMDADGDYAFLWNGGFIRGLASYYASPMFKLTGSLAYIDGDSGYHSGGLTFTDDATAWAWSAEGRYRFGRSVPVDFWVRYAGRQEETHYSPDYRLTSNQLYVGFSWAFGGDTVIESDRNGASVDTPSFDWFRLTAD